MSHVTVSVFIFKTHFLPLGETLPAGGGAELRQRSPAKRNLPDHHLRQDL